MKTIISNIAANTNRLQTIKTLRLKALKNIKKQCELNNNLQEFTTIKNKLIDKEKKTASGLSLSFYQNLFNLSLINS
jgi:hypothetical protein